MNISFLPILTLPKLLKFPTNQKSENSSRRLFGYYVAFASFADKRQDNSSDLKLSTGA